MERETIFKEIILSDNPTIIDVGSYDGNSSCDLLKIFPNASIYAFEIDERSIELFKKNPKTKDIVLTTSAVSNVDGEIKFYRSDSETRRHNDNEDSWSASSSTVKPKEHLSLFKDITFYESVTVPSIKLDTWIKDTPLDIIDLAWVDVNGAEKNFIEGAVNTLNNKVKYLHIEFSEIELYEGSLTLKNILKELPLFEEIAIFDFFGNFGNVLLKNTKL